MPDRSAYRRPWPQPLAAPLAGLRPCSERSRSEWDGRGARPSEHPSRPPRQRASLAPRHRDRRGPLQPILSEIIEDLRDRDPAWKPSRSRKILDALGRALDHDASSFQPGKRIVRSGQRGDLGDRDASLRHLEDLARLDLSQVDAEVLAQFPDRNSGSAHVAHRSTTAARPSEASRSRSFESSVAYGARGSGEIALKRGAGGLVVAALTAFVQRAATPWLYVGCTRTTTGSPPIAKRAEAPTNRDGHSQPAPAGSRPVATPSWRRPALRRAARPAPGA